MSQVFFLLQISLHLPFSEEWGHIKPCRDCFHTQTALTNHGQIHHVALTASTKRFCFKIEEYRNTITFLVTNPYSFQTKALKHIRRDIKQSLEAKHVRGFVYYLHISYLSICSETYKSNLQFFGQYNPHCCMLWPELKSTSLHTREKALAEKHC